MKREAGIRRRREECARKTETTIKLAYRWHGSQLFADFVAAFEAAIKAVNLTEDQMREANAMLEWTKQHAAFINPLTDVPGMLGEFKRAIYPFGHFGWRRGGDRPGLGVPQGGIPITIVGRLLRRAKPTPPKT